MNENERISAGAEKVEKIDRGGAERADEAKSKIAKEEARAEKRIENAKMKAEKEEKKRVRAEREHAEKMHERAERAERTVARRQEKQRGEDKHAPGFGGWLAAVVALSVTVLALGAIVTVGYFDLKEAKASIAGGYQSAVYEFSELVENMDANLAKARVADGGYEMQKVRTDVLVESELAEKCLEQFPCDGHASQQLTAFVNRVSDYTETLLHKLAAGQQLTAEETEVVEYMYSTTEKIRAALPALVEQAKNGTLEEFLNETGEFSVEFGNLSNTVAEVPKSIEDGPFSQSANSRKSEFLAGQKELSESEASARANEYFAAYEPTELRLTGKTEGGDFAAYAFEFKSKSGEEYYAQITVRGGYLALLDGYNGCTGHNLDVHACKLIAQKYLEKCGYADMRPVWAGESGSECCINFVRTQGGVLIYPEMIKVKVCEEKGAVTGMEAHSYLAAHADREIGTPSVSREKIEANAEARMELHGVRLAIIPVDGQEVLTYEIRGDHGGRRYYAYVDANTGKTVEIFTVVTTDRGDALL